MKKIQKIQATCNQCGKPMDAIVELEKWTVPVCIEPSCPNFGLLQISIEKINEFIDKNKKQYAKENS